MWLSVTTTEHNAAADRERPCSYCRPPGTFGSALISSRCTRIGPADLFERSFSGDATGTVLVILFSTNILGTGPCSTIRGNFLQLHFGRRSPQYIRPLAKYIFQRAVPNFQNFLQFSFKEALKSACELLASETSQQLILLWTYVECSSNQFLRAPLHVSYSCTVCQ